MPKAVSFLGQLFYLTDVSKRVLTAKLN